MHVEILVEDESGRKALELLVPKILGGDHTFRIIAYRGIGRIPSHMRDPKDARNRILLDALPKLLRGYGRTFAGHPLGYRAAVVLVCDLDDRCLRTFREELLAVLNECTPRPTVRFCIAIEEGEAWFLGDTEAVLAAFPRARRELLASYVNDSICGTWERLADAICPGGARALVKGGWSAVGAEKSRWAEEITPHMDTEANRSPSYAYFRDKLRELAQGE